MFRIRIKSIKLFIIKLIPNAGNYYELKINNYWLIDEFIKNYFIFCIFTSIFDIKAKEDKEGAGHSPCLSSFLYGDILSKCYKSHFSNPSFDEEDEYDKEQRPTPTLSSTIIVVFTIFTIFTIANQKGGGQRQRW